MSGSIGRPGTGAERFRRVIAETIGLRFEEDKLPWLDNLLSERVIATRSRDVDAYLRRLSDGPGRDEEIAALASELCVSETYFFRDTDQFRVIAALIERWHRSGDRQPFRVLSAGSSTGAEAYSIAITALEIAPDRAERDVAIHAIDVSPAPLETARSGLYSPWALRATPDPIRAAYFVPRGDKLCIDERVRRMVTFEQRNLADADPAFWKPGRFELVCCRNVLMYLTAEVARGVVERIERSLVRGGWLFLGHAENLRGLSQGFHLHHTHDTFYYSRRSDRDPVGAAEPRVPSPSREVAPKIAADLDAGASWVEAIRVSAERIAQLSAETGASARGAAPASPASRTSSPDPRLALAMQLIREDRFAAALELLSDRQDDDDGDVMLLRAVLLATSGDVDAAEDLCHRILANDELNAGAHYVRALCREHRGDQAGAMEHDRAAAYLDPDFAMPHLHLGLLARRSGDLPTARRELGVALALLAREQAPRLVLFGGGFSREGLMQLCRAELRACGPEQ